MIKPIGLVACLVAAFALTVTPALAAQPRKGAVYVGSVGGESQIKFEVAKSGRTLTHFSAPLEAACSNPAPGNPQYPKQARISGGRFTVEEIVPAHSQDSVVFTGSFTANGGVTGKIAVATQCLLPPDFKSGPVKHKTVSWSGTSEPQGKDSGYCFEVSREIPGKGSFTFASITEIATTCKAVDEAIHAGSFTTTTTPPDIYGQFATPGWTCTRNTSEDRFTCTKAKASFSFTSGL